MNPPPGNEKLKNYKLAEGSFAMSLDSLLASYREKVNALAGVNSSAGDVLSSMPAARLIASSSKSEMRSAISPFLDLSLSITLFSLRRCKDKTNLRHTQYARDFLTFIFNLFAFIG